jgi:hypothetical protein
MTAAFRALEGFEALTRRFGPFSVGIEGEVVPETALRLRRLSSLLEDHGEGVYRFPVGRRCGEDFEKRPFCPGEIPRLEEGSAERVAVAGVAGRVGYEIRENGGGLCMESESLVRERKIE